MAVAAILLLPVLWWGSLVLLIAPIRLWLDERQAATTASEPAVPAPASA
jgi:hypothetical protein